MGGEGRVGVGMKGLGGWRGREMYPLSGGLLASGSHSLQGNQLKSRSFPSQFVCGLFFCCLKKKKKKRKKKKEKKKKKKSRLP